MSNLNKYINKMTPAKSLLTLLTLLMTFGQVHAGPTVSSSFSPGSAQDDGVSWYASGKLAQVSASVTGEGGFYYVTWTSDAGGSTVTPEGCCTTSGASGNVATLYAQDASLTVTLRGGYKLLGWTDRNDYGSRCANAGSEWDTYISDTRAHELLHHDFAKGYMTQQRISQEFDQSWPDSIQANSARCVTSQDEFNTDAQAVLDKAKTLINPIVDAVWQAEGQADNTHQNSSYRTIDVTKDCSNIPLHVGP